MVLDEVRRDMSQEDHPSWKTCMLCGLGRPREAPGSLHADCRLVYIAAARSLELGMIFGKGSSMN